MVPTLARRTIAWIVAGVVFTAAPALATTFSFGTSALNVGLSVDGSTGQPADVGTTQSTFSTATTANFRAEASADSAVLGAEADVVYVWDVPYTITRIVTVSPGAGVAEATFPTQLVAFDITFSGAVGIDDDFFSDESATIFDGISVISLGSLFTPVTFVGGSRVDDVDGQGTTLLAPDDQLTGYGTTVNFEDGLGAGEVSFAVPTDYRAWVDLNSPFALDYSQPQAVGQSFTDTLRISMHLNAVSSAGGGEALACAGLQSGLGNFALVPNCGDGLTIFGQIAEVGSETVLIPEPGTAVLFSLGVAILAAGRGRPRQA